MRPGRASSITDLGGGTLLRIGGHPEHEAAVMALAGHHGYPVPRVVEIRPDALVLERIDGGTMADHLVRRPWTAPGHMRTLARLHDRLHRVPYEGASLVHFDLHPENVLLGPSGPVVIDWTNARAGEPASDVALTWLILQTSAGVPGRLLARLFARAVGRDVIRRGLSAARTFRLADPHVTAPERERASRAAP